ncbi:hypothetical protein Bbelb_338510 [Branchiostoma belcheri]|nr:hypothetical protein Bbelb_338510 [Branchiostoma belcheri]
MHEQNTGKYRGVLLGPVRALIMRQQPPWRPESDLTGGTDRRDERQSHPDSGGSVAECWRESARDKTYGCLHRFCGITVRLERLARRRGSLVTLQDRQYGVETNTDGLQH